MLRRSFLKFLAATPLGRLAAGLAATLASAAAIYLDLTQIDVALVATILVVTAVRLLSLWRGWELPRIAKQRVDV